MTSSAGEAIAGLCAGFFSTLATHPLDLVKTRLQVDDSAQLRSTFRILRDMAAAPQPLRVLYRGLSTNLIGNTAAWGCYFLWYHQMKLLLAHSPPGPRPGPGLGSSSASGLDLTTKDFLLASAAAGALTALCTNPIWVVKTRVFSTEAAAPGAYRGFVDGIRSITREEGLRAWTRGLAPSLLAVSHGAVQFTLYERLKQLLIPDPAASGAAPQASNLAYVVASGSSKIVASLATYPFQVLRSRLQKHNAAREYTSMAHVVQRAWAREGVKGFYKGLVPNVLRVLPNTCITFLVYENARRFLAAG